MKQEITVAILQPSYLPWVGYFDQILRSDFFVFYDDVQYTKRDWRNRNYIKMNNGKLLLSVPVVNEGKCNINQVKIDYEQNWIHKHLESIKRNYSKSRYFKEIFPLFEKTLKSNIKLLSDLNIELIKTIIEYLDIKTIIEYSSKLDIQGGQTERLVNICKYFNATTYLTGDAAQSYLDLKSFEDNNILVEFQKYNPSSYTQLNGDFIPYLSIIDLLFNHGKEALPILKGQK